MQYDPTTEQEELLVPKALDAEEAVLGSCLIDAKMIEKITPILRPEDFYRERNGKIYAAMLALHQADRPVNYITLDLTLRQMGGLGNVDQMVYLGRLLEITPTSYFAPEYAREVKRTAKQRHLISVGGKLASLAYGEQDPDEAIKLAVEMLARLQDGASAPSQVGVETLVHRYLEQLDFLQSGDRTVGIPTGLTDLDAITGGLQRSDLFILAARPAMGKTSLATCIGLHVAQVVRKRVLMFSLEMAGSQVAGRILAEQAGVSMTKLRMADVSEQAAESLGLAAAHLAGTPFIINDTAFQSVGQVREMAKDVQRRQGLGMVIVDYLQLLSSDSHRGSKVQEVTEISRALKGLARELNVPVLALSQLSRSVESRTSKVPQLSDLRESGAIEQDSDVVAFLYREDYYVPDSPRVGQTDLILAKHRNGPTGTLTIQFDAPTTTFRNLEAWR
jgi:replicative DNA helicase